MVIEQSSVTPIIEPMPALAAPMPVWRQRSRRVQHWLIQVLAAFGLVSVVVMLSVLVRPALQRQASPTPSAPLLPTIPSTGIGDNVSNGIATVNQSVAKRWNADRRGWELVAPSDTNADVVVTLNTVDFNNGEIVITWTTENHGRTSIRMPLVPQNIQVADSARMSYTVDAGQSQPAGTLLVGPGEKKQATVVVPQPVRSNAITLRITLLQQPFSETVWVVNVPQP
jgi:hypothetical protein